MQTTDTTTTTIDVRSIAPRERHARIFAQFDALPVGGAMQLVNDHDPRPLRYQLQERSTAGFDWVYLASGPEVWGVEIRKTASASAAVDSGSCCSGGACGG